MVGPSNSCALPAATISEPRTADDGDPPVGSVTSEATLEVVALVARHVEHTRDGILSAAARLEGPLAASLSSWRATQTSWVDICLMVGRLPGEGGAAAMEKPREVRLPVGR
jgi:hypothetical protein